MKKTNIDLNRKVMGIPVFILIIGAFAIVLINSNLHPVEKFQQQLSLVKVQASFTEGQVLTKDDFLNNQCRIAQAEQLTIRCDIFGNEVEQPKLAWTTVNQPQTFVVQAESAHITSFISDYNAYVRRTSDNSIVCSDTGGSTGSSCIGQTLTRGVSYSVGSEGSCLPLTNCAGSMIYWGRPLSLFISAPQAGIDNVPISASINCIKDDITTGILPNDLIKIDSKVQKSIALTGINDARNFPTGAYRELASITPIFVQNKPATCDFQNQLVTAFTGHTSLTGQCYALADSSQILVDGRSKQNFCCSNAQCQSVYGLSADYNCVNNFCEIGQSTGQCIVVNDCGNRLQFIEQSGGSIVERTVASCTSNQCIFNDRTVSCNPERAYPNNQCCKYNPTLNSYEFNQCATGLLACDTLGVNACCTAQQTQYTEKAPPAGKICCQINQPGIGVAVNSEQECQDLAQQCTTEGLKPSALKPCCNALTEDENGVCKLKGTEVLDWTFWVAIAILIVLILFATGYFVTRNKGGKR